MAEASPLRQEAICLLGGLVRDAVMVAIAGEAGRRGKVTSPADISLIIVPSWLYKALGHVEGLAVPTILGKPLAAATEPFEHINVHFSKEGA